MTRMIAAMGVIGSALNLGRNEINHIFQQHGESQNVFTTISKVCEKEDSLFSPFIFSRGSYGHQFQPFLPKGIILSSFTFCFSIG